MRSTATIAFCLLVTLGTAAAEEEQPAQKPSPPTVEQAAEAVLQAVEAKDEKALEALAAKDEPDPWFVADELCYRGKHDAADAFAKAAPRVDTEKLPAYVAAWRKRDPDTEERDLLAAMIDAIGAKAPQDVLAGTASLPSDMDTVVRIRLRHVRGAALQSLHRAEQGEDLLHEAGDAALALGWLARASWLYELCGRHALERSALDSAQARFQARRAIEERRGRPLGVADALQGLHDVHLARGEVEKALALSHRILETVKPLGNPKHVADALFQIGATEEARDAHAEALVYLQRALDLYESLGDLSEKTAQARLGVGVAYSGMGEYGKALAALNRVLRTAEAQELPRLEAVAINSLGILNLKLGRYTRSLAMYERALSLAEANGMDVLRAGTLVNIGNVYNNLGEYARALHFLEEGHRLGSRVHQPFAAKALGGMGTVKMLLGDAEGAASLLQQALHAHERMGNRRAAAITRQHLSQTLMHAGHPEEALEMARRSHVEQAELGHRVGAASALAAIGVILSEMQEYGEALKAYEAAHEAFVRLGNEQGATRQLLHMAQDHADLGQAVEALALLERARREAKSQRQAYAYLGSTMYLARLHLGAGRAQESLGAAREALEVMESMFGGLAEEEGASARRVTKTLFDAGVLAAVQVGDLPSAVTFLESGRAGMLLATLGNRDVLRWKAEALPGELQAADLEARDAERRARRLYERARRRGTLKEIREAAAALDEATDAVQAVTARIQREVKRQASLYYPRAASIEAIRASLDDGEVLVIYGLCFDGALAMVLRRDVARCVPLGPAEEVREACAKLTAVDAQADVTAPLARLKALIVEPLKLGADVTRILVSPEGPLAYLPLGVLFDRPVAATPSGTTHVLLQEEEGSLGAKVLALGDPDYGVKPDPGAISVYRGGLGLTPLPATRREAASIGDVTLLGAAASEAGLREALAKQTGWRAVHFACHGLVRARRPMLSSLALTRAGEDDGLLTGTEVLRMQIPADLVVLSACETAKGSLVEGEGILGLTRFFMYAGARRVICSLWKVDDEATQALMSRFYELWDRKDGKRGPGAAAALKKAQAFVRDHPKHPEWKHPYYWAAWVLWGLPE